MYVAAVALGDGAPLLPRKFDLRLEELARNKDFCALLGLTFGADPDAEYPDRDQWDRA